MFFNKFFYIKYRLYFLLVFSSFNTCSANETDNNNINNNTNFVDKFSNNINNLTSKLNTLKELEKKYTNLNLSDELKDLNIKIRPYFKK